MSRPNNQRTQPGGVRPETVLLIGATLVVFVIGVIVYGSVKVGHWADGLNSDTPKDPFALLADLATGKVAWPVASTITAGLLVFLVLAVAVFGWVSWRKVQRGRSRVDTSAAYLGQGEDIVDLTEKSAAAAATRLTTNNGAGAGVPIGRTVNGNQWLYGSWEDTHIDIWGPRIGKTSSRVIPAALEAPGALLTTSNKRDLVDATRDVRAKKGQVWVFDPQGVAEEKPSWWWNPLDFVVDETTAAELAGHFAAGSRKLDAKPDAYFDPEGETLLANLLLAAALDDRPITAVRSWLTRLTDESAVDILNAHDIPMKADELAATMATPAKQREGIYGVARQMSACLTNRSVIRWVTPNAKYDLRPRFDPSEFVRGSGTLYSLSREGKGTAGPLVTALTVATTRAAEQYATASAGGRLPTPMLVLLDEAANVCRWTELPELYSHYGSRGIILMTILQSRSQAVKVWGETGLEAMWSAANVKVVGGGVSEVKFLEDLSKLAGDYDKQTRTASHNGAGGSRNINHQIQRERILTVADLGALPKGRALVIGSSSRPTLVKTVPWWETPHAAAVQASIDAHSPEGTES